MWKILDRDNLNLAYKEVMRNKGASGVDGMELDQLGAYLASNKAEIRRQLLKRTYQPQPVKRIEIPKPNGGTRLLGVPTVVDRFVQQAISRVLTPIFDRTFHENSYGFRPRRYAQQAIIQAMEYMNDGFEWVVDIDLERFFDTVHHDRLMNLFSRTIKDGDVVSIVRKFLVSGVKINDEYKETIIGTPQGGNLSPLLSNIMLNELDQELEQRGLRFVRYADDCIIFVKSEMSARRVMRSITKYIEETLGLVVNTSKSKIVNPNDPEFKFLGFGFYKDRNDSMYRATPHRKSIANFKYKLKRLTSRKWSVSMTYRLEKINQLVRGWINYFKIGKMKGALKAIDAHTRFRLRMCIWKQWKSAKRRRKSLEKLGASKTVAYMYSHSSKSCARVANSWILTTTVTNQRLSQRGLLFGLDYYLSVHVI
jgi:group II intron reverse transcriptase/maturase